MQNKHYVQKIALHQFPFSGLRLTILSLLRFALPILIFETIYNHSSSQKYHKRRINWVTTANFHMRCNGLVP